MPSCDNSLVSASVCPNPGVENAGLVEARGEDVQILARWSVVGSRKDVDRLVFGGIHNALEVLGPFVSEAQEPRLFSDFSRWNALSMCAFENVNGFETPLLRSVAPTAVTMNGGSSPAIMFLVLISLAAKTPYPFPGNCLSSVGASGGTRMRVSAI